MANEDYVKRVIGGPFCPTATLTSNLDYQTTTLTYSSLASTIPDPIRLNRAAMINDEIVAVVGISGNTLTIDRGCCDTIPAPHAVGSTIWFFDDSIGSDEVEYGGTETIGVKLLPRTANSGTVPIEGSPPNELTFNFRFARPYPPGNVNIDGVPWQSGAHNIIGNGVNQITVYWAHRDRITQADQLVGHSAPSVGPEAGVTYTIVLKRLDTDTIVRTVTGITGNSWTYTRAQAGTDLGSAPFGVFMSVELFAVRGSLSSLYSYLMSIQVIPPLVPISFVGSTFAGTGTSSVTVPTHQAGDLILFFERIAGAIEPGDTPTGFTPVLSDPVTGGIGNGWKICSLVDLDNSVNQITVSSSNSQKVALVYRGTFGPNGTALSPYSLGPQSKSYPGLTIDSSRSWVFGIMSNNQGATITTSGLTVRESQAGWTIVDSSGIRTVFGGSSASGSWNTDGYASAGTILLA